MYPVIYNFQVFEPLKGSVILPILTVKLNSDTGLIGQLSESAANLACLLSKPLEEKQTTSDLNKTQDNIWTLELVFVTPLQ